MPALYIFIKSLNTLVAFLTNISAGFSKYSSKINYCCCNYREYPISVKPIGYTKNLIVLDKLLNILLYYSLSCLIFLFNTQISWSTIMTTTRP